MTNDGVPVGDFLADTTLQADPERPGRFTLDLSSAWNIFYTFGGMTMAVGMRAAANTIERDDLHPLAVHALFCSPIGAGPVVADVETLRAGRTATQLAVDVKQGGSDQAGLKMLATFGQRNETPMAYQGIEFPSDVRPPEECPTRPEPADQSNTDLPWPRLHFHAQTDWRPALAGFTWEEDLKSDDRPARFASWHRMNKVPRLADGRIDPVSLCVPADMLGAAVSRRLGTLASNQPFFVLSLEINLQFFAETDSEWTLQNATSQHAGDGYAYGTTELWDGHRRLIGFATQRAYLRPFKTGEAVGPRRRS